MVSVAFLLGYDLTQSKLLGIASSLMKMPRDIPNEFTYKKKEKEDEEEGNKMSFFWVIGLFWYHGHAEHYNWLKKLPRYIERLATYLAFTSHLWLIFIIFKWRSLCKYKVISNKTNK